MLRDMSDFIDCGKDRMGGRRISSVLSEGWGKWMDR